MPEINLNNQAASKILVIGGSTYNPCTPCKIRDALVKTKFLEEWAVILANHKYWQINDTKINRNVYEFKINSEFKDIDPILIDDELKTYTLHNNLYILPDPSFSDPIFSTFSVKNSSPQIEVLREESTIEECILLEENRNNLTEDDEKKLPVESRKDALGNQRGYLPCIDKIMKEVASNYNQLQSIAGLIICGMEGDGAIGLKEIKSKGGKTAVQHPDECVCPHANSMPKASLSLDNSHQIVSLEVPSQVTTLTEWLSDIKWR
jgi:hypothetical protein